MALRIDPNLLVIQAMLLKTRSVTESAIALGMSQPSVSRALGPLRSALNDPLLVRSRIIETRAARRPRPVAAGTASKRSGGPRAQPPRLLPEPRLGNRGCMVLRIGDRRSDAGAACAGVRWEAGQA